MPRIRVDVAEDGMLARISVDVAGALPEAAQELDAALSAAGVGFGIDESARVRVLDALHVGGQLDDVVIARGLSPKRGFDGYFLPAFEPGIRPGQLREDGTMDFRDRELLKTVRAGEQVGRLVPPTPGVAGVRVDGEEVAPQPGAPDSLKHGDGVVLDADGTLKAASDGAILYVPRRSLAVVRELAHRGDVDMRTGHLTMQGSVRIQGNVTRGFHVHATGDIDVRGECDGGELRALGNVRVRGGIRAGSIGSVEAQGDVFAARAEAAQIVAQGSVCIGEIVHSHVSAYELAVEKRAIGGRLEAEHCIVAGVVGSAQGVPTILAAAVLRPSKADLLRALASAKAERQERVHGDSGPRGDDRAKGGKLGRERGARSADAIEQKLSNARAREEAQRRAYVRVSGELHPGSLVIIGDARWEVGELARNVRISYDETSSALHCERITR